MRALKTYFHTLFIQTLSVICVKNIFNVFTPCKVIEKNWSLRAPTDFSEGINAQAPQRLVCVCAKMLLQPCCPSSIPIPPMNRIRWVMAGDRVGDELCFYAIVPEDVI